MSAPARRRSTAPSAAPTGLGDSLTMRQVAQATDLTPGTVRDLLSRDGGVTLADALDIALVAALVRLGCSTGRAQRVAAAVLPQWRKIAVGDAKTLLIVPQFNRAGRAEFALITPDGKDPYRNEPGFAVRLDAIHHTVLGRLADEGRAT